jgi:hypothetical protein
MIFGVSILIGIPNFFIAEKLYGKKVKRVEHMDAF